jgi:hypothetical protein
VPVLAQGVPALLPHGEAGASALLALVLYHHDRVRHDRFLQATTALRARARGDGAAMAMRPMNNTLNAAAMEWARRLHVRQWALGYAKSWSIAKICAEAAADIGMADERTRGNYRKLVWVPTQPVLHIVEGVRAAALRAGVPLTPLQNLLRADTWAPAAVAYAESLRLRWLERQRHRDYDRFDTSPGYKQSQLLQPLPDASAPGTWERIMAEHGFRVAKTTSAVWAADARTLLTVQFANQIAGR